MNFDERILLGYNMTIMAFYFSLDMRLSSILGFSIHGARLSAHETHFKTIAYNEHGQARHVIFKKNKCEGKFGEHASELEASFTAIANLLAAPHRALKQDIVRDQQGNIIGVCTEHAAHALLRLQEANRNMVFLKPTQQFTSTTEVDEALFHQWIESHRPVSSLIPLNHNVFTGSFTRQRTELQQIEAHYVQELEHYWQKFTNSSNDLQEVIIADCIHYSRQLLNSETSLDLSDDLYDLLAPYDTQLLDIVFTREAALHAYEQRLVAAATKKFTGEQTNKWEELRRIEDTEEALDRFGQGYFGRLAHYWEERRTINAYPLAALDKKTILECANYIQSLLDNELPFNVHDIPQDLIAAEHHDLLTIIYEWEFLKRKCDEQFLPNVRQELELSRLDVGAGFNFLDKLPQNFFARLLAEKNKGALDIDMDSLADVLVTAYGLEEDDLHKGNIGYYVTSENNRPCFHFFKIDHDLMFSDKVMSARSARIANLSYTGEQFRIQADDLLGFPDLRYSGNHYWPTKRAFLAYGDKAYQNNEDREAYKSLKDDLQFQHAKWQRFFKQAIIPQELVIKSLKNTLETVPVNPETASTLAIVQRATASRISELKIALVELAEFRAFMTSHHAQAQKLICDELRHHAIALGCSETEIAAYEYEMNFAVQSLLIASMLSTSQTALHTAVLTQSYRCYETRTYFYSGFNAKDAQGWTALDRAICCFELYTNSLSAQFSLSDIQQAHCHKMITYYADVICDLQRLEVSCTVKDAINYRKILTQAQQHNSLALLPVVTSLAEYKKELEIMRSYSLRTLKHDKVCALALLDKAVLSKEDLLQLKTELGPTEPEAPLKFIKQLRSEIWIVKKIRGAYGSTTTSQDMLGCIDRKIAKLQNTLEDDQDNTRKLSL